MIFFSTDLEVRFVKEFHFPSKAAAKVVSLFLPPNDGETFFWLPCQPSAKCDSPSVESGRKGSASLSCTKTHLNFFETFFSGETLSH